ncbi:cytochrome P450 [Streptomyces boncukensis]|uniref:Cytochrome P450 n=1 Tax=Streptomyces boncukensis TaxID=2711219 RepID=A0A6G4WZP0_9ACTN|nr:cytochrome P450 [Streptomyces boncukensis]NGO69891.1 cytochrome P450 [Streptomyces boncukensis]
MKSPSPIPTAPGALPLLGHVVPLLRDPLGFLTRLPEYGDVVQVRIGPVPVIVVCDPALTRHVLLHDQTFDKGGPVIERVREFLGNGLATCQYSEHRHQRRLLQPAFLPARIPGYTKIITARSAEMTNSWQDGQALNVLAAMQELMARITADTLFSATMPSAVLNQCLNDLNTIFKGLTLRLLAPPPLDRLPTPGNRHYHQARARLRHTLSRVITDYRSAGTDHGDLLSALLAACGTGTAGHVLTDAEISDQIMTFFFGGSGTTGATLAWALYVLGHHPDVEARLHAEADAILDGRPATHADLPHLELTDRIITETLRLWPPGLCFTRTCTADTRLGPYPILAGSTLAYSAYLLHRRGDLYPDPERFDPDRWVPGNPSLPRREAFTAFGGGARRCIGDRLGIAEAVLVLATIAARWRLEPLPGARFRPTIGGNTLTVGGLRMSVVARKTADGPGQADTDRKDPLSHGEVPRARPTRIPAPEPLEEI